MVIIIIY